MHWITWRRTSRSNKVTGHLQLLINDLKTKNA